jgi:hypothetical protein
MTARAPFCCTVPLLFLPIVTGFVLTILRLHVPSNPVLSIASCHSGGAMPAFRASLSGGSVADFVLAVKIASRRGLRVECGDLWTTLASMRSLIGIAIANLATGPPPCRAMCPSEVSRAFRPLHHIATHPGKSAGRGPSPAPAAGRDRDRRSAPGPSLGFLHLARRSKTRETNRRSGADLWRVVGTRRRAVGRSRLLPGRG